MEPVRFESKEERDQFLRENFEGEESQRIAGEILDGNYLSMEDRKQRDIEVVSAILKALKWWYPKEVIDAALLDICGFVTVFGVEETTGLDNKDYPKHRGKIQE